MIYFNELGSVLMLYVYVIVTVLGLILLLFGCKRGLLGVWLRNEEHNLEHSKCTLSLGTSIMLHSIKNELQKLLYLSERIKHNLSDNEQDEALQNVDKIFEISENIEAVFSKICSKSETIELNEGAYSIVHLIRKSLQSIKPILETKKIQINEQYLIDADIQGDQNHLLEVFQNLFMNAIDAIEPNKGVLRIKTYQAKGNLYVEIIDNGKGIEPASLTKVFEPFYSTKKGISNYGLGLSYCQRVLQKHDGSVTIAKSEVGKGTTMLVHFPKKRILLQSGRVELWHSYTF